MSHRLLLRAFGMPLLTGPFLSASWAEDIAKPGPLYPPGSDITFQWNYFLTAEVAHSAVREPEEQVTQQS
jgi:hypothetical protein